MVILQNIQHRKFDNTNPQNIEDLQEYKKFVKRLVKKYAPRLSKNDDVISYLITEAILADCRWDPTKGTKKSTFKYNTICFKIKRCLKSVKQMYSLNHVYKQNSDNEFTLEDIVSHRDPEPIDVMIKSEDNYVERLLNSANLTKKERKYIELYYLHDVNIIEIAKSHNVSKQSVQQTIQNSLRKLKECSTHLE